MRELFRSILIEAGLLFCGANSFAEREGGTNSEIMNGPNPTPEIEFETINRDIIKNTGVTEGISGIAGGIIGR